MPARADQYHPSLTEFLRLAKRGNTIPIYREILADFETPLSAYLKLEGTGPAYLLESVEQGETLGRFSFLGSSPTWVMKAKGRQMELHSSRGVKRWTTSTDPLKELEKLLAPYRAVPVRGLPRFCGGAVGFAGYDTVRFLEPIGGPKPNRLGLPDSLWMMSDTLVIFDHIERLIKVVANAHLPAGGSSSLNRRARLAYAQAVKRIEAAVRRLKTPVKELS